MWLPEGFSVWIVQFKPNLLWRTSTRNSTSFNLKLFTANLTPGLAQPPSSEIHIANANRDMYLTKSALIYFIPFL